MGFDLDLALRRVKPSKRVRQLVRRPDHDLPFIDQDLRPGLPLLLDTTVYIDVLQGRAPPELGELLSMRQVNHSAIALSELTHLFGRLDPADKRTQSTLKPIAATIADVRPHRLSRPSIQASAEAGIITGVIARLQGLSKSERQPLFNDASLFLQAREAGCVLVSRNVGDMDLIEQLVADGRLLLYRHLP